MVVNIDHMSKVKGRILNVVNGDLGNADTSYTYIPLSYNDASYLTLQFTIEATTLTLEGTNDSLDVADAAATWTDITNAMTGAASWTVTGAWIIDTPLAFGRVRVKRLTTNLTNALALYLTLTS